MRLLSVLRHRIQPLNPLSVSNRVSAMDASRRILKATVALCAAFLCSGSGPGFAQEAVVDSLRVYPPEIILETSRSRQLLVVQAVYSDGITRDVTSQAQVQLSNAALVRQEGSTLYPAADGEGQLTVSFGGKSLAVPVKVTKAAENRDVSFRLDIMPIFMKTGCNTGSCHGAARGKDGFRLSLFGFDPEGDHYRLTRELSGRRLDLAVPSKSLLIEKAVGAVPHTGGKRFAPDSEICKELERWVDANCPNDPPTVPTCTSIAIYPTQAVLDGEGEKQQVTVIAKYSDGTTRDVTSLSLFLSNDDSVASINPDGSVTAGQRGEAYIMARFATHTVGSQYIVLPKGLKFSFPPQTPVNYVDELVNAKLQKLRMAPSAVCDDETFLRRVYLDLTGTLPTTEDYQRFVPSPDPQKRLKLIDELLERKEFTEIWVQYWAEWLMIRSNNVISPKAALLYYNWLADQIGRNVQLDKMVQELLSASGGTFKVPQTNYYQNETDILKVAENVAQVFMGMRIQCAQCHNHPFDRWTMDDYYSFAAFFSQIGRKGGEDYREAIIFNSGGGEVAHPVGGRQMPPKFLGGAQPDLKGQDRRVVMAKWLASPENPYFAQNFTNRVWSHFFGRGIIDQVDDVRISNPSVNPELLAELSKRFTESNYNFKQLVRDICRSDAYQRSTARNDSNKTDEKNFAHANLRRLKAESLLDCISQVTGTKDKFPGLPVGARAVQIVDGNTSTYFLTTFGRANRETVCSCEVKMEPTLSQALHLLNGDTVNGKIQQGGLIAKWLGEKVEPLQIVERLYVGCVGRKPTAEEVAAFQPLFPAGADPKPVLDDLFWSLLNSREFLFNH